MNSCQLYVMLGPSGVKMLDKTIFPSNNKTNKPKSRPYCHFIHSTKKSYKLQEDYRTGF